MATFPRRPAQFTHPAFHRTDWLPPVWTYCVGYEAGVWRVKDFAEHIVEWLPEVCLTYSEVMDIESGNSLRRIKKAARALYQSEKYQRRGEFGEVLLHIVVRDTFETIPAISKIHFKDTPNDTIKGFDLVHIVPVEEDLELWLGEAKFYEDPKKAARDAADSLKAHANASYLRSEFVAITNKIDPSWPHGDKLTRLLDKNTSLDEVFDRMVVPVLLAFPNKTVAEAQRCSDDFHDTLREELHAIHSTFAERSPLDHTVVRLFLLPVADKKELSKALDEQLKGLQT